MKKCEHIKELILTEYIDGLSDKTASDMLEGHLLDCNDCRDFFKEVKGMSKTFQSVPVQQVPDELWMSIQESLAVNNSPWEWWTFPKLVPVFASLVVMVMIGSVSFNMYQVRLAQEKEQGEYLVSTLGTLSPTVESNDLGTPIEHYFL